MFASMTLFGVNSQTTYTVRDEVYRRVDDLCRRAGVLGPSTFSPVTGRVLVIALDRIDVESLGETDRAEYGRLYRSLTGENYLFEDDGFAFDIDAMSDARTVPYTRLMAAYRSEKLRLENTLRSRRERRLRPRSSSRAAEGPADDLGRDGDPGLQK